MFRQEADYMAADAAGAAGDHDNLFLPVVGVRDPVVEGAAAQVVVDPAGEAEV